MQDGRYMYLSSVGRNLAALLVAGIASAVIAAPLSIVADLPAISEGSAEPFLVEVRESEGAEARQVQVVATQPTVIEVRPGLYEVRLSHSGYWAAPATIYVTEKGGRADLTIHAATRLEGRFKSSARSVVTPPKLWARFGAAGDDIRDPSLIGETECRIAKLSFSCDVPAARLDVAIKAPGHVSRYWWNLDAKGDSVSIGTLDLRPGASLVGHVTVPREHAESVQNVILSLVPVRAARSASAIEDERIGTTIAATAKPNRRGFFAFEGLAPGAYVLDGALEKLTARKVTVNIIEKTEAELRESLVLEAPGTLVVEVTPAQDPWERPWILVLARRSPVAGVVQTERQGRANEKGNWSAEGLPSGDYSLEVRTENQDRWLTQDLSIPLTAGPLLVEVSRVRLRGTVTLGGSPLQAGLILTDRKGASIRAGSDSEGRFGTYFPRLSEGRFSEVTINAAKPPVATTLQNVRLEGTDDEDRRLDIALPGTVLTGEVIDTDGKPVSSAVVTANHESGISIPEIRAESDGTFRVHGLPEGFVRLRARGDQGRAGDAVRVQISDDSENPAFVQLVLRDSRTIHGNVVSATGPVPGAIVHAFPRPGGAFLSPMTATDAKGHYTVRLPSSTEEADFFVAAPGFAVRMFRHRIEEAEMNVPVSQNGGTLVIEMDLKSGELRRVPSPSITHRGAAFRLGALFREARVEVNENLWRATVPDLEPGAYTVCEDSANPSCFSVNLAPFASSTVRLSGSE